MKRSILFLIATTLANGVLGGLPLPGNGESMLDKMPGPKMRFVLHNATVTETPNEYLREGAIIIKDNGLLADIHTDIVKEYPSDIILKVAITYATMTIPPMELEACLAFHEQFFVQDVITKGEPQDKFPHQCPIPPGDYWVRNWAFPHYKIPPGTPPGPVKVLVELCMPNGQIIMKLDADGELVLSP